MIVTYKPIQVEAFEFPGYPTQEIIDLCGKNLVSEQRSGMGAVGYFLTSVDGYHAILQKNDWVVKHLDGQVRAYKPDLFHKSFDILLDKKK